MMKCFKTMENVDSNFDSDRGWGSEGSLCRLAVGLNKLGHEVDIFGGIGYEKPRSKHNGL